MTEADLIDLKHSLASINESVQLLQTSQAHQGIRMAQLEDRERNGNIKIRGVVDSLPPEELPHFIRHLVSYVLPAKKHKTNCLRRHIPNSQILTGPRDIILCCQTLANKQRLLSTIKGTTPLQFESQTLTFFQDFIVAKANAANHNNPTKCWPPLQVVIPQSSHSQPKWKDFQTLGPSEGTAFLQALGLQDQTDAAGTSHALK
ncbi:Hypothetical predicted protein, partial [Pelobates cultripes]